MLKGQVPQLWQAWALGEGMPIPKEGEKQEHKHEHIANCTDAELHTQA